MSQFPGRLVVVDPGHFHAALLQQHHLPGLSRDVSVYAPLSPDLLDYLARINQFNHRPADPTSWRLNIHAGPDFFSRLLQDGPSGIAVFAGRNREKIERIHAALDAGLHVLADKPWILRSADLPLLDSALRKAQERGLAANDMMTERFEITSILQRVLVNDPDVFGSLLPGTPAEPAITARSVHHLMKLVAGVPIRRPAWFFDIHEYGEALGDVGTHVVDLVQWIAFPQRIIDPEADIRLHEASRWPTVLSDEQFRQVTGAASFPAALTPWISGGELHYFANNSLRYSVAGVHIALDILWNWEAASGEGDTYEAAFRGTRARVEIRQGPADAGRSELYVVPAPGESPDSLLPAVTRRLSPWPGVSAAVRAGAIHVDIPVALRVGHEAHFAQVAQQFLALCEAPAAFPAWDAANLRTKYWITTRGVEAAGS